MSIVLAGFYLSAFTIAYGQSTTNYLSRQYRFTLEYPSTYELKRLAGGFFALIGHRKTVLWSSVEDDTFRMFLRQFTQTGDLLRSFARERVKVICTADRPDGSCDCETVASEREERGVGCADLRVLLGEDKGGFPDERQVKVESGALLMVDISRPAQPLALMIFPGYGILASEDEARVMRQMVETVRVDE